MKRSKVFWVFVYALCVVVEFFCGWLKEHASEQIKAKEDDDDEAV